QRKGGQPNLPVSEPEMGIPLLVFPNHPDVVKGAQPVDLGGREPFPDNGDFGGAEVDPGIHHPGDLLHLLLKLSSAIRSGKSAQPVDVLLLLRQLRHLLLSASCSIACSIAMARICRTCSSFRE